MQENALDQFVDGFAQGLLELEVDNALDVLDHALNANALDRSLFDEQPNGQHAAQLAQSQQKTMSTASTAVPHCTPTEHNDCMAVELPVAAPAQWPPSMMRSSPNVVTSGCAWHPGLSSSKMLSNPE